jgi:hypothetical protein
MKKLEKILLFGSSYCILILTVFYLFALISGFTSTDLSAKTFFLSLLFGMIISFMEEVYKALKIGTVFKIMIHYAVMLFAFCLIFVAGGNISASGGTSVFVAVVIFTVMYALFYVIIHYLRRGIKSIDEKIATPHKSGEKEAKKTATYTSLYK